jgi:hypothetical protein
VTAGDRRSARWAIAALAVACIFSIWPIVASQSVPAFQQDWVWPLSRPLAWEWLKSFIGLWDARSTGHANLLPWQTYAVAVQFGLIAVFGSSLGLALWIAVLEFLAAIGCVAMLAAFGVTSWPARISASLAYAFGPVVFTRLSAGHLAYLVGYALLPLAMALAFRAIERRATSTAIWLGVVIGLAASQIQFLAIAWIAIAPLPLVTSRAPGWGRRLWVAAGIAVAVQLQALLPLEFGSAASVYGSQPALISFEYNNSAPLQFAPVMLGYFTHYYETHAPPAGLVILYALLVVAVALALHAGRRCAVPAISLVVAGTVLSAGLYGPLSVPLQWAFEHAPYAAVFRDLHYFAALTALGVALGIGVGLQRLPLPVSLGVFALAAYVALPVLSGSELRELLVPPAYASDALADMQTAAATGPGRVLWLPAEEPVGLVGAANAGRDFAAYGPANNPSVSDDYQNPQLAYALATLRSGKPDWNAFAELNIRYLVVRNYVRSARRMNFGTGFPMAFEGIDDVQLARFVARVPMLRRLRSSALSSVYEFPNGDGYTYVARSDFSARLYSELRWDTVAIPSDSALPSLQASRETADPRNAWVDGTLGWRYAVWLPDSIYPFVWTISGVPLELRGTHDCILAGALPRGAWLRGDIPRRVSGTWRRYAVGPGDKTFIPTAGDVSAIVRRSCGYGVPHAGTALIVASGYDAGWRAIGRGRVEAPVLANGWMMAWDARLAPLRLVYLPTYLQLAGFIVAIAVLVAAVSAARAGDLKA